MRILGEFSVPFIRLLIALFGAFFAVQAHAATMNFTFTEVGTNVLLEANGSFDISSGTTFGSEVIAGRTLVGASDGLVQLFPGPTSGIDYVGISLPALSFGTVGFAGGLPSGQDAFGFCSVAACNNIWGGILYVPTGYVSGDHLSNSATFLNTTFAWRGLIEGQTVYNYGDDDRIIVQVGDKMDVVPLPASLPLLLVGFGGLALVRRRQRVNLNRPGFTGE